MNNFQLEFIRNYAIMSEKFEISRLFVVALYDRLSMTNFQKYKQEIQRYSSFGLQENPFSIAPLFRSFKNRNQCQKEEMLFTIPENLEQEIEILISMYNCRVLVYGLYGVGKTSLVDFLLYLSHNFHKHFCSRVIITEDNVHRAIQEVLFTLAMDIVSEISQKSVLHPIQALQKWWAEKKYTDTLIDNMFKLVGKYSEHNEENKRTTHKKSLQILPQGIGVNYSFDKEIEIRKSIQAYVEVLPLRKTTEYMEEFVEIIQAIGYKDIFIFIDEADHLEKTDEFIRMLTKAREVLFSAGYSFFIAGSIQLARYLESMGTIFDKTILVPPTNWFSFINTLEKRLQAQNQKLKARDIFDEEALQTIHSKSKGVHKSFLRLAQNALDRAAMENVNKVTVKHCEYVLASGKDEVTHLLKEKYIRILKYLAKNSSCSPSNQSFQAVIQLKRVQLRSILEELLQQGYLHKQKKGRETYYSLSAQYLPYFREE
jgi:type II secretory pathway predicted ATPase ExeA